MTNLFDTDTARAVRERITRLTPTSRRQWGKMSVGQVLAHCSVGIETATGARKLPRVLIGRVLGRIVKPLALRNDDPLKKNSPTAPAFIITDNRDFVAEQRRLLMLYDGFVAGGRDRCTTHPHAFFGRLTPDEWSILMYKHLDHHLRQFGA